jgi:magnesium-transporting ATPase (P-type)
MEVDLRVILIMESKAQTLLIQAFLPSGKFLGSVSVLSSHLYYNCRVTLILYQNIVPISLYISVEIVKTLAVSHSM